MHAARERAVPRVSNVAMLGLVSLLMAASSQMTNSLLPLCVMAVPARRLASKVVNSSGRDVDKFEAFGLTTKQVKDVSPPLLTQCFANLECRVTDWSLVEKYNLFILQVVNAWIDPAQKYPKTIHHQGYGRFVVDGPIILRALRAGGNCRALLPDQPWRTRLGPLEP